ncbi:hypothetical protein EJ08DRAFT_618026 [Tothia fuscella]|uniref:Uncharacterized protein n=1 Tax=Tothia fuscella TaxID=1048955 RepID=A0A9P4NJQ6_9PEZI|nr:hypothetical protein EJ08DRAFT_618026 [Tothia fuscella]
MYLNIFFLANVFTLPLSQAASSKFGPKFDLTHTDTYIVEAQTTLFPPSLISPVQDSLLIWAGMPTDAKDRAQGVLASFDAKRTICRAARGEWCVFGRIYSGIGRSEPLSHAEAAGGITIRFTYNANTGKILQSLMTPRRLLATYEAAAGRPKAWLTAVECQENCVSATIGEHYYRNTTIKLAATDPSFGRSILSSLAGNNSPVVSYDGGKTWSISSLTVQKSLVR